MRMNSVEERRKGGVPVDAGSSIGLIDRESFAVAFAITPFVSDYRRVRPLP